MGRRTISCINCASNDHEAFLTVAGNRGLNYINDEHQVVLCRDCGLGFLNPQHEEEDYARYYATADYKPIKLSAEAALRAQDYRRIQAAFLIDTLDQYKPDWRAAGLRAMDIGCGLGVLIHHLRRAGLDAAGVESSPNAAEFACNTLGLPVTIGTVYNLHESESQFDIVTSTASIEHFTDPLSALKSMRELLVQGGLIYVNTQDLFGMVLKKGIGHWFKFVHTYYYTEATLSSLIEQAGYSVIRSFTMPPILKASVFYPGNYCSGELNIIAVRRDDAGSAPPLRREKLEPIKASFESAIARDRRHQAADALVRKRPIRLAMRVARRFASPQPLFTDYLLANGEVNTSRFPPLLAQ